MTAPGAAPGSIGAARLGAAALAGAAEPDGTAGITAEAGTDLGVTAIMAVVTTDMVVTEPTT